MTLTPSSSGSAANRGRQPRLTSNGGASSNTCTKAKRSRAAASALWAPCLKTLSRRSDGSRAWRGNPAQAVAASVAGRQLSASDLVLGVDAPGRRVSSGATAEAVSTIDRADRLACLSPCAVACSLLGPLLASRLQE